jgi:hypothetical protein
MATPDILLPNISDLYLRNVVFDYQKLQARLSRGQQNHPQIETVGCDGDFGGLFKPPVAVGLPARES